MSISSQKTITVHGIICDAYSKEPIENASIEDASGRFRTQTDINGHFSFDVQTDSTELLNVKHPEYYDITKQIDRKNRSLHFHLKPKVVKLHAMTVTGQSKHTLTETTINTISVNRSFFQKSNASNLSASLAKLPGIASMDIGSGVSKPLIRGMGFNRMAVVDKGIVIQNQQWGADHGLELDQFDIDKIIIHKGAMSLFYGSDAMGGVVEILPAELPGNDQKWGDAILTSKSNNDLIGSSLGFNVKSGKWFYRMRATTLNYGDYRIPTDSISYLTWKMPVDKRRMKNTAGKEINLSGSIRYDKNKFNSAFYISNSYSKNGFFPGAHGVPDLRRLAYDGSYRNIELPHSTVNHFKITNSTEFPVFEDWKVHSDFGFQNNKRAEYALFHTHFPNQPIPKTNKDRELAFDLNTFSGNIRLHSNDNKNQSLILGISAEYQMNKIGGYSFLMPEFERITGGIFGANNYKFNNNLKIISGLRIDWGKISTHGFYDPILENYFTESGYDLVTANFYAQRAKALNRHFTSLSGSVGVNYQPDNVHLFKANLGRSFRFPTPNELASSGVHHGAFRFEQGNENLKPEIGLQLDLGYEYNLNKWHIKSSPFVNYFSNFIFLNPTGQWSLLPHTGQQYEYAQSKALMAGGEIEIYFQALDFVQLSSNVEYTYTQNLVSGYALPFSPPTVWTSNAIFSFHAGKFLSHFSVNAEAQRIFAQNQIANNEIKTPGAWLFNLNGSFNWSIYKRQVISELQLYNIFDTAYLNHLSYYRKLNAPEPGRNIQILLKFPF
ncbi:MAG: TonB-dependent receptor [Porphyromonadaceae bacterium]|nr:TonB-dependent receptor [Porphyromonadaceae bacterium]